ncbi:vWA domain-containing protein [Chryseosolibacter indicus]|uniref:von Willebrand factor type A domain-containing protein n=1 Tax=Chryseosolibacter indicus TaxID=2782351 RepID=A0ABS5VXU1_9BACT|nr:von Willebrand factor type A domain-containing protein [Chryseosolibacter indicus]MBT1705574.1 von Willebrand factor type A domain-containing protein [Chryseosolibacter indicus]
MKKISAALLILFALVAFNPISQRTITGTVTSASDGSPIPGVSVILKGTKLSTSTDQNGKYTLGISSKGGVLVFSFIGYKTVEVPIGDHLIMDVKLEDDVTELQETIVTGYSQKRNVKTRAEKSIAKDYLKSEVAEAEYLYAPQIHQPNTEEYATISENGFHDVRKDPLSTFSIDVDKASYSNVRRFLNYGQRPPVDAVRIEELVNYFSYDYKQPVDEHPFAIHTEVSEAPWNKKHKLIHIGIQGREIPTDDLPPSNLVFLIDVSGSMDEPEKLPLVKQSFKMLVDKLRPQDHVAIVVYAGAAGKVLEPTPGNEKKKIISALDQLQAGGSTAGGEGLRLAYELAQQNYREKGNNRVIIATDGDFNVGESSNEEMEKLITEKRKDGIFLTVLGYGMGNYKDSKMEILADKGNGNYAYIDNISEARKTLVHEFGGTLFTIAKDVKLQLEFNPSKVKAYRLIGYENRLLKNEDFNNDKKDAGELGSGHTVTALYEVIPSGVKSEFFDVDDLKYQNNNTEAIRTYTNELFTIKFRYKKSDKEVSRLITHSLVDNQTPLFQTSDNFRWAASVAAFAMLLRESAYVNNFSFDEVTALAQGAKGKDEEGYRAEFINLTKSLGLISKR